MESLKTNYKDQLLDTSVNTERKFNLVDSDGNVIASGVSLRDITQYSQAGDTFGAADINKITEKINEQNNNLTADGLQFQFATDGEGNYGFLGADGSLVPFSKGLSVLESIGTNVTFTAPKDGTYGFVSTQSNCGMYGYPVITTTGEKIIEIQLTDTHANQYYGGWLHLMKMKKGDTFLAYKNTNGITPRCYVFY